MDKPSGPTSHDVVARVRRVFGIRAVGHTGTLDPFATGLLVLLLGRATRLARFVEAAPKTYRAVARLGSRTDTDDRTGAPLGQAVDPARLDEGTLRAAVTALAGERPQRPPAYSAKRIGGVRSYRLARRGRAVELAAVPVTVHRIELLEWRAPDVTFRATVSAGTYVRALARDLGEALEVGGHLVELRREAIGRLKVEDAVPLDRLEPGTLPVPLRAVLGDLPAVALDETEQAAVRHGRMVADRWPAAGAAGGAVALLVNGEVVGVARREEGRLQPVVVLEGA
ncbi:MAG TPA: tRNA pseudouridine(55) synthase TruB [Gemmatimonadales bacterium]